MVHISINKYHVRKDGKLDEAINDMEQGRVQTIDEAWEEIDTL